MDRDLREETADTAVPAARVKRAVGFYPFVSRFYPQFQRFLLVLFVFSLSLFATHEANAEVSVRSSSYPDWIVNPGKVYSPEILPDRLKPLVNEYLPKPVIRGGAVIRLAVEKIHELSVQGLDLYAISYFSVPPYADVASMGTYLLKKQGKTVYHESNPTVSPSNLIVHRSDVSALVLVKSDNRETILFKSYEDTLMSSFLRSFNTDGVMISLLVSEGRGELVVTDIDNDGVLEVSGYRLHLYEHLRDGFEGYQLYLKGLPVDKFNLSNNSKNAEIYRLAQSMGVQSIYPTLLPPTGLKGIYQVFSLNATGAFVPARGSRWKHLYQKEAERILVFFDGVATKGGIQDYVNAATLFLGVLEGMDDPQAIRHMYLQLPHIIRGKVNPKLLAKYWKIYGYPKLIGVFD